MARFHDKRYRGISQSTICESGLLRNFVIMQYRNRNRVGGGERPCDSCSVIGLDGFLCVFSSFCNALDTRSHVRFDAHACTHDSRCVTLNPSGSRSMRTRGKTFCRNMIRIFARVYITSNDELSCFPPDDVEVKILSIVNLSIFNQFFIDARFFF